MSRFKLLVILIVACLWIAGFLVIQFDVVGVFLLALLFDVLPGNEIMDSTLIGGVPACLVLVGCFRRNWRVPAIVLALVLALAPLNLALWSFREESRTSRQEGLRAGLEKLREQRALPHSLADAKTFSGLAKGPFGIDPIFCKVDGEHFEISSYGVPIGPWEIYESKTGEWRYEE